MSTQWLVIAPRPNVGARLATVGPCQTRADYRRQACRARVNFVLQIHFRYCPPMHSIPVVSQRLTVTPSLFSQ